MTERPIPFNVDMVRAVMRYDGPKTQTRRIVVPQPEVNEHGNLMGAWLNRPLNGLLLPKLQDITIHCPYGQPGDRLWVREAWSTTSNLDAHSGSRLAEMCLDAGYTKPWAPIQYEADGHRVNWEHTSTPPHDGEPRPGRYRHGRFMPRWASRITLEVTGVRIERLQEISEGDALAEGCPPTGERPGNGGPFDWYRELWDSLNAERGYGWDMNPWVWVVEFRRMADVSVP